MALASYNHMRRYVASAASSWVGGETPGFGFLTGWQQLIWFRGWAGEGGVNQPLCKRYRD